MTNFNNTNTTENVKIKAQSRKIVHFFAKLKTGFKKLVEEAPAKIHKAYVQTVRFVQCCIRAAVTLSVISIAVIMIYTFFESHPAELAQCTNAIQSVFEPMKNAAFNIFENIQDTMTSLFG